jgi:hypothetical protein
MLLLAIMLGVGGYSLLYAGLRGDNAQIGGVPLWRKPWLPLFAAFSGGGVPTPTAGGGSTLGPDIAEGTIPPTGP